MSHITFFLLQIKFKDFVVTDLFLKMRPELGTLEWDTINPDCLIQTSNVDNFNFLLNPLFLDIAQKNQKPVFKN